MLKGPEKITPEIAAAFRDYDQKATLNNLRVACFLGIILMPVGVTLDYFVYPEQVQFFLLLRLVCSALIAIFLGVVLTPFGQRHYRVLSVTLAMFPTFFMSWMIYLTEGAASPYYAGLNLVLLVIGFVLNWSFFQSFAAVSLVFFMYVTACRLHGPVSDPGILFNNLYFLSLTGLIVVTGSHFHTRLRLREFALRFELDQNRQQLEASNQKLLELDQVKSRFFANISHELRTPLTLLLAPLERLLHGRKDAFDGETRGLLITMHANSMRLLKLINDLLDLVRLESGRLQLKREPLAVAEFVQGLASAVRPTAEEKQIHLQTVVEPALGTVLADRDKLEKILLNLLFNALKFTPAGGQVALRAETQNGWMAFRVEDTGVGIAEKNLPHVFDRFWQADDSSRRKYQGVGIGLALVKELAEFQGGSVSVQSHVGQGTTFSVHLPCERPLPGAAESTATEPPGAAQAVGTATSEQWLAGLYRRAELFPAMAPSSELPLCAPTAEGVLKPTILIADDEPDMLRFLQSQLVRHYRVLQAVDGQQAIDQAEQFRPDIILLDLMMPKKDGLEACQELRTRASTQGIPIILLTARADEETKLAALSAGASDFLTKPFSTTELHVRVRNLIDSYDYQRKLAKQNQALEQTIEQLKETETQLVQTEKLASLGRLSAGIIHEINNPLNFAVTGLFTLRHKTRRLTPEEQTEYAEIFDDVQEGLDRVKAILSDLRSFSHHENQLLEPVEVAEVVSSALRFLSHQWRENVRVEQRLADSQTLWANKNKLVQICINLLQNSLDALARKHPAPAPAPTIWIEGWIEHDRSLLRIRDNGDGIAPEHLDKIFDPFFTTKDVGDGMGLGLSISYRIVQEYDGRILVRSEPGKFCEFTLDFPLKEEVVRV